MKAIIPARHEHKEQRPFLHRYRPLYRLTCLPDAEWQRCKLEQLRYKWGGYKDGTRLMQRLGDWGRKMLGPGAATIVRHAFRMRW